MRAIVTVVMAIVVWAALFGIEASAQTPQGYALVSAVVIGAATIICRLNLVQKWLALSRGSRAQMIDALAQVALIDICRGRTVTDTLFELRVHIWEIPIWYRRMFPYRVRQLLKRVTRTRFSKLAKLTFRPMLKCVSAIGLRKHTPAGICFRKGEGLVGICVAANDRNIVLLVDFSREEFKQALRSKDEATWNLLDSDITYNLSLDDATTVSHAYSLAIAQVIQDPKSGEAVGCMTVSLKDASDISWNILESAAVRRTLALCTSLAGGSLAL